MTERDEQATDGVRSFADRCADERIGLYRTLLALTGEPETADDLAQDTIVRALAAEGGFRGDAPLGAWLHRIALNAWRDHLRRRRWRRWLRLDATEPAGLGSDDVAVSASILDLRRALARLPDRQRAAIVLRYYHDYDYAAIALALETTPGTVGSLLSRALDRLAGELDQARR